MSHGQNQSHPNVQLGQVNLGSIKTWETFMAMVVLLGVGVISWISNKTPNKPNDDKIGDLTPNNVVSRSVNANDACNVINAAAATSISMIRLVAVVSKASKSKG